MTGNDVIQPELPHVHLPVPMTLLKVCVHEGKGLVAQGAMHVHTFVSVVTIVGRAYHIIKYIMYNTYWTSLSSGFLYMYTYTTLCPSNPFHFAKCQQCSQVNAWPWEPGVDFKKSLKHQGFSPQFSPTWLVKSLSQSKKYYILQWNVRESWDYTEACL